MCCQEYKDNRESCAETIPSSCVPYTGYISDTIKKEFQCRPNVNDIIKKLQDLIDKINENLGDNTKLEKNCLDFDAEKVKQSELNQLFIVTLCQLKADVSELQNPVDPNAIKLAINLLCLQDPSCDPKDEYTLTEVLVKLIAAYCSLLTRVQNIENVLNI